MRGHIRKRSANSWELKYDVPRLEGGRHIVYRSVKGTRREAAAELARLLARVADGAHVDPTKLTTGDHVRARFKQWQASGVISPKTAERYAGLIEHHIVPYIGGKLLQKLSTRDIETWHATLLTRGRKGRNGRPDGQGGISARTIGAAHRILSKALREGMSPRSSERPRSTPRRCGSCRRSKSPSFRQGSTATRSPHRPLSRCSPPCEGAKS
jgi:hypothetical protein